MTITSKRADRWFSVDYPVLVALAEAFDSDSNDINVPGVSETEAQASFVRLWEAGYIDGPDTTTFAGRSMLPTSLTERGRRAVGEWPSESEPLEALVAALTAAAERTNDLDERSKLQKAIALLGGVGGAAMAEGIKAWFLSYFGPEAFGR